MEELVIEEIVIDGILYRHIEDTVISAEFELDDITYRYDIEEHGIRDYIFNIRSNDYLDSRAARWPIPLSSCDIESVDWL